LQVRLKGQPWIHLGSIGQFDQLFGSLHGHPLIKVQICGAVADFTQSEINRRCSAA
jgi:hypothetical protein